MSSEIESFISVKTNIDLLFEYASNPDAEIELPPKVKEEYDDITLLDEWMVRHKNKRLVIQMFMRRKKDRDPEGKGVHIATAYRRFELMERVFGRLNRSNKEYRRVFLEEWFTSILKKMENTEQWRSIPSMAKVLLEIADLSAADEIPEAALLNPIPIIVGNYPELVGERMTKDQAERARAKLTKKRKNDLTEDVDFEEMSED